MNGAVAVPGPFCVKLATQILFARASVSSEIHKITMHHLLSQPSRHGLGRGNNTLLGLTCPCRYYFYSPQGAAKLDQREAMYSALGLSFKRDGRVQMGEQDTLGSPSPRRAERSARKPFGPTHLVTYLGMLKLLETVEMLY